MAVAIYRVKIKSKQNSTKSRRSRDGVPTAFCGNPFISGSCSSRQLSLYAHYLYRKGNNEIRTNCADFRLILVWQHIHHNVD